MKAAIARTSEPTSAGANHAVASNAGEGSGETMPWGGAGGAMPSGGGVGGEAGSGGRATTCSFYRTNRAIRRIEAGTDSVVACDMGTVALDMPDDYAVRVTRDRVLWVEWFWNDPGERTAAIKTVLR